MASRDRPGAPDDDSDDGRFGRHRARHAGAAPEPYAEPLPDAGWRDRDGWRDRRYDDDRVTGWPPPEQPTSRSPHADPMAVYWPPAARDADPPTADWPLVPAPSGRPVPDWPPASPAPDWPPAAASPEWPPTVPEPLPDHPPDRQAGYPPAPPGFVDPPAGHPPVSAGPAEPSRSTRAGRRRAQGTDPPKTGRAGRNLPAAIGIAILLAAVVLGSLLFWREAFLAVIVLAVGVGMWEMTRAVATMGAKPPLVPLLAGGTVMAGLAWYGGPEALCLGLLLTVLATMVWRLADGPAGYQRDVTTATLIAVYVPFLGGFAALLAAPPADGHLRLLVTLAAVVLSDTGGYVAGVFFGRRPMAPTVSPKKSWEGLAGSLVATASGSALLLYYILDVDPWWGAVYGVAVSAAAVLGDLTESMLKRDLGVKDMSNLLPGHGGLMDRLDSILLAVPTSYLLLSVLATTSG